MIRKIIIIFLLISSCTSDDVIKENKAGFFNIYKNLVFKDSVPERTELSGSKKLYDKKWLSQFNQPIIGISLKKENEQATLVALGNYKNKLTWVSSNGISLSFIDGILISTRGYSEDLIESQNKKIATLFKKSSSVYKKKYRYLDGQNRYKEVTFNCSMKSNSNIEIKMVDLTLGTTKFSENCISKFMRHSNEFYVLPGTRVVLKSKQWISPSNGSVLIYNYYAFQSDIMR